MNHVPKMNRTEFVDLKFYYNFYSLYFSVRRLSMIASPSKKVVQRFHEVQKLEASTVSLIWQNTYTSIRTDIVYTTQTWRVWLIINASSANNGRDRPEHGVLGTKREVLGTSVTHVWERQFILYDRIGSIPYYRNLNVDPLTAFLTNLQQTKTWYSTR
jgi:hypothetical protein